jgi:hypothetical protein
LFSYAFFLIPLPPVFFVLLCSALLCVVLYCTYCACLTACLHSITAETNEELRSWKAYWVRHLDILQNQEAALWEKLNSLGCDPSKKLRGLFEVHGMGGAGAGAGVEGHYSSASASAGVGAASSLFGGGAYNSSSMEVSAKLAADREIDARNSSRNRVSSTQALAGGNNSTKQHPFTLVDWVDEHAEEEEPIDKIQARSDKARCDTLVLKYADKEDLVDNIYPKSFESVVPKSVLKALFHAR